MSEIPKDKIFVEKNGNVRVIIEHGIGWSRLVDCLRKSFKAHVFEGSDVDSEDDEKIILLEEK